MKRVSCLIAAACLILGCTGCRAKPKESTISLFAMDTYVSITAYGPNPEDALDAASERIQSLERLWSVTDTNSEIYTANHSGGKAVTVSKETCDAVSFALNMARETDGALEPTLYPVLTAWGFTTESYQIPAQDEIDRLLRTVGYQNIVLTDAVLTVPEGMQLDLGAVGKGYAADETAIILREHGVTSALLDFGGNILAIGAKADGSPWRVGVRDPDARGNLGVLEVADQSVVVSGGYERYFVGEDGERYWHILDPATGCPANRGLIQTAVIGSESKRCDALSTALYVMGLDKAVEYWRAHQDFEMILLAEDRTVYMTEGLSDTFFLSANQEGREVQILRYKA